jgi:hypothetical protein
MPRVFAVAYGGGHIRALLPVLDNLEADGWHVDLLALTTAHDVAAVAGRAAWRARDFIEPEDDSIRTHGARLAGGYVDSTRVPIEETRAYLGFGYTDLVARLGAEGAADAYRSNGRACLESRTLAARAIERAQPDVVLATNSPRTERAAVLEAQRRGIPAVVLNDLFASASNFWLHDPSYADRICVLTDFVRERLIAAGHDPAKIVVTGNPAFEPMIELALERQAAGRRPGRPRIMYASQELGPDDRDHRERAREALRCVAAKRPDWEVTVRLNPSELDAMSWAAPPLEVDAGTPLRSALRDTDVLITHGSAVGLEAAIAGIPVIQLLGSRNARDVPYHSMGYAVPLEDLAALETTIERTLFQPVSSASIMPGGAAQRVARAIEAMLSYSR